MYLSKCSQRQKNVVKRKRGHAAGHKQVLIRVPLFDGCFAISFEDTVT